MIVYPTAYNYYAVLQRQRKGVHLYIYYVVAVPIQRRVAADVMFNASHVVYRSQEGGQGMISQLIQCSIPMATVKLTDNSN